MGKGGLPQHLPKPASKEEVSPEKHNTGNFIRPYIPVATLFSVILMLAHVHIQWVFILFKIFQDSLASFPGNEPKKHIKPKQENYQL